MSTIDKPFNRLLLTGAGGGIGTVLRDRIKPWARVVRLADIGDLGEARPGEEIMRCDLADRDAVLAMMEGVDAVLHFGGISVEDQFVPIMNANILGLHHLYEAVHKHGVGRVVYASSSHTVGFYRTTERVDADMPLRPDGFYGLSKCFGEALSRYYYDRCGIETVCLRIGSSFPEPKNARMMTTYLAYDDLVELVRCALFTPRVGHTIAFGTSANATQWWDNGKAAHLGYVPRASSQAFAGNFPPTAERPPAGDPTTIYQGGPFVSAGPMYRD
ncbi:uronate dehydrogenase [Pseudoduganella flava]|uniref:NAD-dependent epimerase/dehydratase family protein n=1 Tax=Pseudoduganella flava TaxID=871742 RepID=A0A562PWG6_9BURK|nr:NAD(P)-dependent oxidoreductase [Pseudoduganella flava]QGZ39817.1 NAD-dependent epimerase/dehydratase family protein [Pseudoduganella flava]TWI48738.1 uronate dehydrogenase [Pseudoduganella flava]